MTEDELTALWEPLLALPDLGARIQYLRDANCIVPYDLQNAPWCNICPIGNYITKQTGRTSWVGFTDFRFLAPDRYLMPIEIQQIVNWADNDSNFGP